MSLFFQPGKRFSNKLRMKDRKGSEYRRLLKNRKRQDPLPGTKKLLHGESDEEFGELLEELKEQHNAPPASNKEVDALAIVLAGFIFLVLFGGLLFQAPPVVYAAAALAFILLHVVTLAGQLAGGGPNQRLLLILLLAYGGFILWFILLLLKSMIL